MSTDKPPSPDQKLIDALQARIRELEAKIEKQDDLKRQLRHLEMRVLTVSELKAREEKAKEDKKEPRRETKK